MCRRCRHLDGERIFNQDQDEKKTAKKNSGCFTRLQRIECPPARKQIAEKITFFSMKRVRETAACVFEWTCGLPRHPVWSQMKVFHFRVKRREKSKKRVH